MQGVLIVVDRLGNTITALEQQNAQLQSQVSELQVELAKAQTALDAKSRRKAKSGD